MITEEDIVSMVREHVRDEVGVSVRFDPDSKTFHLSLEVAGAGVEFTQFTPDTLQWDRPTWFNAIAKGFLEMHHHQRRDEEMADKLRALELP